MPITDADVSFLLQVYTSAILSSADEVPLPAWKTSQASSLIFASSISFDSSALQINLGVVSNTNSLARAPLDSSHSRSSDAAVHEDTKCQAWLVFLYQSHRLIFHPACYASVSGLPRKLPDRRSAGDVKASFARAPIRSYSSVPPPFHLSPRSRIQYMCGESAKMRNITWCFVSSSVVLLFALELVLLH
jgi:hypothetical protein